MPNGEFHIANLGRMGGFFQVETKKAPNIQGLFVEYDGETLHQSGRNPNPH